MKRLYYLLLFFAAAYFLGHAGLAGLLPEFMALPSILLTAVYVPQEVCNIIMEGVKHHAQHHHHRAVR